MIRKSIYLLEDILSLIDTQPTIILDGDKVNLSSLRLRNFKYHGITCVHCGLQATFFAKEKTNKDICYHLNLYGHRNGKDVLFTKDHIVPISKNGANVLENLQTMCAHCNCKKGNICPSSVKLLRDDKYLLSLLAMIPDQELRDKFIIHLNKSFCSTITCKPLSPILPLEDISKTDPFHSKFIDLGVNVTIAYNIVDYTCTNFYIYNKSSGSRMQVGINKPLKLLYQHKLIFRNLGFCIQKLLSFCRKVLRRFND